MSDFRLGMNAKVFIDGTAGTALASLTELDNTKDVTLSMEAGETDTTTRANSGWRGTAATLREGSAEFDMVWKTGDTTGLDVIQAAFLASTTISAAVLTGALATADSDGPFGDWSVTNFTRSEALEDVILVSITLKMETFDAWITDGAE